MSDDPRAMSLKVSDILFKYRATPLRSGKSSSEMYLGRQIRNKLDAFKSSIVRLTDLLQHPVQRLSQGDYYKGNKPSWKFGSIIKKY